MMRKEFPRCDPCKKYTTCVRYHEGNDGIMYRVCCKCLDQPMQVWSYMLKRELCKHSPKCTQDIPRILQAARSLIDVRTSLLKDIKYISEFCSLELVNVFETELRDSNRFPRCDKCNINCTCLRFEQNRLGYMCLLCCECSELNQKGFCVAPIQRCSHWVPQRNVYYVMHTAETLLSLKTTPLTRIKKKTETNITAPVCSSTGGTAAGTSLVAGFCDTWNGYSGYETPTRIEKEAETNTTGGTAAGTLQVGEFCDTRNRYSVYEAPTRTEKDTAPVRSSTGGTAAETSQVAEFCDTRNGYSGYEAPTRTEKEAETNTTGPVRSTTGGTAAETSQVAEFCDTRNGYSGFKAPIRTEKEAETNTTAPVRSSSGGTAAETSVVAKFCSTLKRCSELKLRSELKRLQYWVSPRRSPRLSIHRPEAPLRGYRK